MARNWHASGVDGPVGNENWYRIEPEAGKLWRPRGFWHTQRGGALGLIQWLRRLVGAGSDRSRSAKIDVEPIVAIRRDRDELTSFISVAPTPTPQPDPEIDATVAVAAPKPAEESGAQASNPAPARADSELPDTTPVESGDSDGRPAVEDSEATLMVEIPTEKEDPPDQDATLFFQAVRVVVGKLVVIKGELKGEEYELREGDNQIGRSPESDVVLPSMWISRTHAVLRCGTDQIEIESLSDKITSVDGEPVSGPVAVANGANIQLGGTVCRLELEGSG